MGLSGGAVRLRTRRGVLSALVLVAGLIAVGSSSGATTQKAPACNLVPQLRDVTINQGVGAYPVLVNGKETLVRFYLSMPSCAGSGASIQVKEGTTLTVSGGGTVDNPTPVPTSTAYPAIASFTAAPMTDSTGDPKFVVPASMVSRSSAFTVSFAMTLRYQSKPTRTGALTAGQITFSNRPGTTTPITASFDRPSNALGVLFVPMGDATKSYSSQWTAAGQQALQDGMTAGVARQYPLPSGTGSLGGTGGLRYSVTPTLLDLKALNLLDPQGKFCGTGANYDLIKAQLAQFRLSHNAANPNAQANRVVGVIDPAIGLGPPSPCFEGMAVVNSQEAWALAIPGRAGNLIGLELAHTLGLTPPSRESPFDGAHSQNTAAENPSVNRRYNTVQRSFITVDRSLLKPSATSPPPDNVNTLLEVPDHAFLLCVFGGGTPNSECATYGPGTVSATAPVAATLSFVMSGTTDSSSTAFLCPTCTGAATGTSVVESYFASTVPQTAPDPASTYRLIQRGATPPLFDQGVPVSFFHSGHGGGDGNGIRSSGLFSFALPFDPNTSRIELWKGAPGSGLLIYARDRTDPPVVTSLTVGEAPIGYRPGPASTGQRKPRIAQALLETLQAEANTPATPTSISPGSPLSAPISFGNSFSTVSQVCLNFHFAGDLLDPGDDLSTSWGIGFGGGATPQRDRLLCSTNSAETNRLLNGSEPLTISMTSGSVTLGALLVIVSGDPIAPVGYRISSNSSSYTVAQGSSIAVATTVTDDPDAASPPAVDLTARNLVPGGSFSTIPTGGTPTFTSNGTLSASASTEPGNYRLVVTAKGGGFTRSFDVTVTVTAASAALVVNTALDDATAADLADGVCEAAHCTLREAITFANANVGTDTIAFAIGSGLQTIRPTTALPLVQDPTVIDGTTQPGTSTDPRIELDGSLAGVESDGLQILDNNITIRGLTINRFAGNGIRVDDSTGITIEGNYIGTDAAGTGDAGNGQAGIWLETARGNTVGGTTAAARNVISGNGSFGVLVGGVSDGNTILGNYVGTDKDGTAAIANAREGIRIEADSNVVGGLTGTARNVVSGNNGHGILVYGASNNTIQGNYAGTNAAGTAAIPNSIDGIAVDGGGNNTVGGTAAGAGNLASGNRNQGIAIFGVDFFDTTGNVVQGNLVGMKADGTGTIPNGGDGIRVHNGSNTTIGGLIAEAANVVRNNGGAGVAVLVDVENTATRNRIIRNSISANTGLGIDLGRDGVTANDLGGGLTETPPDFDGGPNERQNFPVITSAEQQGGSVRIRGTLASTPSTMFRIDYYASQSCDGSGFGEGARWIGWSEGLLTTTGTNGQASFDTGSGLTAPTSVGEWVTATATDPNGNTSEFSGCRQIESALPPGQEPIFVSARDDNPADDTLDLYLDCGSSKPKHVIAVGLKPSSVGTTSASWSSNYDSTLAPANCELQAIVMDGFSRSSFTAPGTEPTTSGPNALVAAISSPREDATFLQYGLIPLRGSIRNAEAELTGAALDWEVDGPGTFARSGSDTIVDLQPPSGGWPAGAYKATFSTPGGGSAATDIVNFTVLTDADNDGIAANVESQSCFGAGADNDPLNADDDSDGDGIPNANDPQPCVPATSYTAIVDFNPDPLPTGSSGTTVTAEVRVPGRNIAQVLAPSVRITRIADEDVSADPRFANIAWTIKNGAGIAKFDRQKLVRYLADRDIHNRVITITVAGRSGAPPWSFEGSDTVFIQG